MVGFIEVIIYGIVVLVVKINILLNSLEIKSLLGERYMKAQQVPNDQNGIMVLYFTNL